MRHIIIQKYKTAKVYPIIRDIKIKKKKKLSVGLYSSEIHSKTYLVLMGFGFPNSLSSTGFSTSILLTLKPPAFFNPVNYKLPAFLSIIVVAS